MTTVVPTSEEDPAISVVRFAAVMSWSDAGPEVAESQVNRLCVEASECMMDERWLDLATLMLTSVEVIFAKAAEKDLECIFAVICNLVKKPESLDKVHEMAELISTKIVQQPSDKPALRLKIMLNLYNLLENPYSRFSVYMKALNLAINGKVSDHVVPSFKKMENLLKEWDLGVKDQRNLFLTISNILKENKAAAKDTIKFLTRYLSTFSAGDTDALNEAKEVAARAIIEFVKAPDMFQCNLLDMPAVEQLKKDSHYDPVYDLLKIFLTQKLDAYMDFYEAYSTLMKNYGLLHEDCIAKMRLMSLVDLGLNEIGVIPYSKIRDTLQIDDNEVESWVVKAIRAKLINCKIDQMNQVVIVSRCIEREFELHQWQMLRTKLANWRENIANVISNIQANKVTQNGTPAKQGLTIR